MSIKSIPTYVDSHTNIFRMLLHFKASLYIIQRRLFKKNNDRLQSSVLYSKDLSVLKDRIIILCISVLG